MGQIINSHRQMLLSSCILTIPGFSKLESILYYSLMKRKPWQHYLFIKIWHDVWDAILISTFLVFYYPLTPLLCMQHLTKAVGHHIEWGPFSTIHFFCFWSHRYSPLFTVPLCALNFTHLNRQNGCEIRKTTGSGELSGPFPKYSILIPHLSSP